MAGLELHQDVDVAVGAEIVPKDRAKQSQPRDVMPLAERRHRVTIDGDVWPHALHDTAAEPR
jgi:hypothetical protein